MADQTPDEAAVSWLRYVVELAPVSTHDRAQARAALALVDRLAAALHRAQKHPDWEYAVTYGDGRAHKPMTGWVRNPAAVDVSGVRPPAVFWMRPRSTTAADVADLVPPAPDVAAGDAATPTTTTEV